jgi:hypothetical protein
MVLQQQSLAHPAIITLVTLATPGYFYLEALYMAVRRSVWEFRAELLLSLCDLQVGPDRGSTPFPSLLVARLRKVSPRKVEHRHRHRHRLAPLPQALPLRARLQLEQGLTAYRMTQRMLTGAKKGLIQITVAANATTSVVLTMLGVSSYESCELWNIGLLS